MRSRNIKPGFFSNEDLARLPMAGRILFQGLWCLADREGRLEDRPGRIKAEVFPFDDVGVDDLLDELEQLRDHNNEPAAITRYVASGKRYIQILNFDKHQRPHSNEKPSEIPPIPDNVAPNAEPLPFKDENTSHHGEQRGTPRRAALRSDSLIPDSLIPDTGYRNEEGTPSAAVSPPNQPFELYSGFIDIKQPDEVTKKFKSRNLGVAKHLLNDGYTIADCLACTRFVQSQSWRTSPWDLKTVAGVIDEWIAEGRPEHERVRGSPTEAHAGIKEFSRIMDEIEGKHASEHIREADGNAGVYLANPTGPDD